MRLIFTFLLIFGLNPLIFAHIGGHHHHDELKQWSFAKQDKKLAASFLSYKEEMVTLEDAQGNRSRFSIDEFSMSDQQYILKRYERIKLLNQPIGHASHKANQSTYGRFGILLFLGICCLIFYFNKPNYASATPFLLLLFLGTVVSFKSYIQTSVNTDPSFIESAFAPFKPNVATSFDNTYFYVESLGIPEHEMMTGITNWQQQFPIPQCYTENNAWSIPLNPTLAASPVSTQNNFFRGAVALAANGVPIFNALNNRGEDAFLIGELDAFGGHCGRADDYHYHTAPLSLEGKTNDILPIAFALDGFAVYGSKEPNGADMESLDASNGHFGADGVYHYHGTATYPYLIGAMVGEVTIRNEQIEPQAASMPIQPAGEPLRDAVITGHTANGPMGYTLTYTLNNGTYTVNYDWTENGQYNFERVDPNGNSNTSSYNAFAPCEIEGSTVINPPSATASITQGLTAMTIVDNLFNCGRIAPLGTITASDNTTWAVPAEVNFQNDNFPFASDLHNPCNGNNYANTAEALAALNDADIIEIDQDGEVITGYVFGDNYFELYINGVAVGKDNVPFTQFNSNLVRFRVKKPFTIAMLLVDWEENLGVGTESNQGFAHHAGDGGMVAVFKDANENIIATTGSEWKAQTFYTAPIKDLNCVSENGSQRLSTNCNTSGSNDATNYYGLHWSKPNDWMMATFDDSTWPAATTYTNTTIGVNNKSAYTNFTDIFDDSADDAEFIWSTNVVLDNEVIVRHTVTGTTTSIENEGFEQKSAKIWPNLVNDKLNINYSVTAKNTRFLIYSNTGNLLLEQAMTIGNDNYHLSMSNLPSGFYLGVIIENGQVNHIEKLIKQ